MRGGKITRKKRPASKRKIPSKEKKSARLKKNFELQDQGSYKGAYFFIGAVIVILAIIVFWFMFGRVVACETEECFLEHANSCKRATYQNTISTATLHYESFSDCSIQKTIQALSVEEPEEAHILFTNTTMRCTYKRGEFDPSYLKQISANLDYCKGGLANIIELV